MRWREREKDREKEKEWRGEGKVRIRMGKVEAFKFGGVVCGIFFIFFYKVMCFLFDYKSRFKSWCGS